ncbi:hypothetical protein G5S35_22265 [Paraburkholderia tropica]|uniref:hypothetical protein n=1 Tax=Paraburkholderia tropica TaxID=92647 RepID=UPI001603DBF1|nr:hypothetical protein [Paraburkholderia tropica]QNB14265.1 hypothetical protein G5S35_22265 [Paraburkholderia tropica]
MKLITISGDGTPVSEQKAKAARARLVEFLERYNIFYEKLSDEVFVFDNDSPEYHTGCVFQKVHKNNNSAHAIKLPGE